MSRSETPHDTHVLHLSARGHDDDACLPHLTPPCAPFQVDSEPIVRNSNKCWLLSEFLSVFACLHYLMTYEHDLVHRGNNSGHTDPTILFLVVTYLLIRYCNFSAAPQWRSFVHSSVEMRSVIVDLIRTAGS